MTDEQKEVMADEQKKRGRKRRFKHYMLRQNLRAAEDERRVKRYPSESKNNGFTACLGSRGTGTATDSMRAAAETVANARSSRTIVGNFHYSVDTTTGHLFLHSFYAPNMNVSFIEKNGLSYSSEEIPNASFMHSNAYVMDCLYRLLAAGTEVSDTIIPHTGAPLTPLGRGVLETGSAGIETDIKIRPKRKPDSVDEEESRAVRWSQMSDQEKERAASRTGRYKDLYGTGLFGYRRYSSDYVRAEFEYSTARSLGMDDFLGGRGDFRDFYLMKNYELLRSVDKDFGRRVPEIRKFLDEKKNETTVGRGPNDMIYRVKRDVGRSIMPTGANGFFAGDFDLVTATETPDCVYLSLAEAKRKEFRADGIEISVGAVQRMMMELLNEALKNSAKTRVQDMFGRVLRAAPVERVKYSDGIERDNFFYIMDAYSGQKYDKLLSTSKNECAVDGWYLRNRTIEMLETGPDTARLCRDDMRAKQQELGCSYLEALASVQKTFMKNLVAQKRAERAARIKTGEKKGEEKIVLLEQEKRPKRSPAPAPAFYK